MGVTENYSWKNYQATILARTLIGIESIDYDRNQKVEGSYGKGNEMVGYGKGKKESSGKMVISLEEYEKLVIAAAPFGGDPLDLPPFPIVGLHEKPNGKKMKETLPLVQIEKIGHKRKVDDTTFMVDIDFKNLAMPIEVPL